MKRLLILHKLNAEIFVDYPLVVEGLETVEEFLTSHKTRGFNPSGSSSTGAASSSSGGTGANTYSGATSSISSLTANVPPLFLTIKVAQEICCHRNKQVAVVVVIISKTTLPTLDCHFQTKP